MALFSKAGAQPTELPFQDTDASGRIWTNLAHNPDGLAACGYAEAPDEPAYDPQSQAPIWANGTWQVVALPLSTLKGNAIIAAQGQFVERLNAGAPYGGQSVQLDDGSQARVTAIGATALAAASGAVAWPDGYAKGWITDSGVRIPLPTATDGLTFAATVGGYYANLVQHEQDLENEINAATDAASVAAVDVTAGWPS